MAGIHSMRAILVGYANERIDFLGLAEQLIPIPPEITPGDMEHAFRMICTSPDISNSSMAASNFVFRAYRWQVSVSGQDDHEPSNGEVLKNWFERVSEAAGQRVVDIGAVHGINGHTYVEAMAFSTWVGDCACVLRKVF